MKITITDEAIVFKTKIFENRTEINDKIYRKYKCSIPKAIGDYICKSGGTPEEIYINPLVDDAGNYPIIFNEVDAPADDPKFIKRKLYLSGRDEHKVYIFSIPNKLINDVNYRYAVYTVTNDRDFYLSFE